MKFNTQKLIAARLRKRWTRTDLARKSGLSKSAIQKIETGELSGEKAIFKISKALGVPMDELFGGGSNAA